MSAPVPGPIGVIAHYNLLERLEPAGPGELFRARDTKHGRTVAVRLLPADFVSHADRREFIESARELVAISHPNVMTVFDVGEQDDRVYVVFEFLTGQSLRGEMNGRPVNVRRAIELAVQMADAVANAHACGYLHSGLSPDSVVITAKGHAKIPTFPLAARGGFASGDGTRLQDYDSPEEAKALPPDERSDVYSLGAVLFEMLAARRPLHRGSAAPSAANPHVPKDLDDVVLKSISPNPDSRHQSAAALAGELRNVGSSIDARGGAGDESDVEAPSGGAGRVVWIAIFLLGMAAAMWWFVR